MLSDDVDIDVSLLRRLFNARWCAATLSEKKVVVPCLPAAKRLGNLYRS